MRFQYPFIKSANAPEKLNELLNHMVVLTDHLNIYVEQTQKQIDDLKTKNRELEQQIKNMKRSVNNGG